MREREGETDRQTDRQTNRQTDRQTDIIPVNPHAFAVTHAFLGVQCTMHRAHFSSGTYALQNFKVDRYKT